MKLQILIPQYKETDDIVKPLLDSIAIQQGIDLNEIGVIIVNDGTNVHLNEDWLKTYPYKIEYYLAPHRGVSATRNTCLDYASADYVMFCDADDMFYNACGLWIIFKEIEKGFDTLSSKFVEEANIEGIGLTYIDHNNDNTFVHGKVHRRQYLIDNDIRWNPNLTIHEDSYFNVQCWDLTEKRVYIPNSFYLWRYRKDSVCRSDPQYILKTYPQLINSVDGIIESYIKRGKNDKALGQIIYTILKMYYTLYTPIWRDKENIEYAVKLENRIYQFYKKYKQMWDDCPEKNKIFFSNQIRSEMINKGMVLETMTVDEWLDKLEKTYRDI